MPMLSHLFHLSPSDVWDLTHEEFTEYLSAAEDLKGPHT